MTEIKTPEPVFMAAPWIPRVPLGEGPTPVARLRALESAGTGELWLKDDGVYGPFGGNKARKLEWLLADARAQGRSAILTSGALATNHGLATALYARGLGMRAILVLVPQPLDEHVARQLARIRASGAQLHFAETPARAATLSARLLARRPPHGERRPYLILPGGSSPRGCIGYVEAGRELGRQVDAGELPEPAHVVVALGSGGTAAGLALGLRLAGLRQTRLHAIQVNDLTPLGAPALARLAGRTQALLRRQGAGLPQVSIDAEDIVVHEDWLGGGYGHSTPEARAAAAAFSEAGVELEPVYTAKAAAGLLALRDAGELGAGPVLFWQTHGAGPA